MSLTLKKENGDLVVQESNGRMYYIQGIEKLSQDTADCLMVTYDPERDFGQELDKILTSNTRVSFLNVINNSYIKARVEEAVARLKKLQQSRPDQLNDYEAIERVSDVQVYTLEGPTNYVFVVDVTPVAGPDKNPQSFSVKLAHQLLGTARPNLPGMAIDSF
jgi:cytochrome oxidase Cu insertion factor (SCO1/SenC/PrrC family)